MKKLIALVTALAVISGMAGCSSGGTDTHSPAYVSPVSLYMVLSLTGTGAVGATQKEILSVLGAGDKKADYVHYKHYLL